MSYAKALDDVEVIGLTDEHYTVTSPGNGSHRKLKTFRGESAWMDAERYANDLLRDLRGSPFGERFVL
jgi:hypothetical protein